MVDDANSKTATFGLVNGTIEDLKSQGLTAPTFIDTFFSFWVLPFKMRSYPKWEFQGMRDPTI